VESRRLGEHGRDARVAQIGRDRRDRVESARCLVVLYIGRVSKFGVWRLLLPYDRRG
jgi:hypothetical protein